jgi:hypothetical protein
VKTSSFRHWVKTPENERKCGFTEAEASCSVMQEWPDQKPHLTASEFLLSRSEPSTPFATCFQLARTSPRSALSRTRENRNRMRSAIRRV